MKRLAILILLAACSGAGTDILEPGSDVTLTVFNPTCIRGQCRTMRVVAIPSNQPNTPGGTWIVDLGVVTRQTACLRIPGSARFTISGPDEHGVVDTTVITWTRDTPLFVGWIPADSMAIGWWPSTKAFVPSKSAGWRASLSDGGPVTKAEACTL